MHREAHAALLNTALGRGYKPPSGEVWTAVMLKPDYAPVAEPDNWRTQAAMFKAMARKPPTLEEKRTSRQAARERKERTIRAKAAADRGVTGHEIQLIMEGRA